PLRPVQAFVVGFFVVWYPYQSTVCSIAPAVVRTREDRCVALIVAPPRHGPVSPGGEKHVELVLAIARQDDGLFPHARLKVVPWLGYLALVADKKPDASEEAFLLLLVDRLIDKDLAAN